MSDKDLKGKDINASEEENEDWDAESRINAAMDKLLADEEELEELEYDNSDEYDDSEEDEEEYIDSEDEEYEEDEEYDEPDEDEYAEEETPAPVKKTSKSARPKPVVYVPMDDMEEDVFPPQKSGKRKKHKGIKITGLVLLILIVISGCAYAGVSYYYSDRFFEGTWINGINVSGKTAYETEELLSQNMDNYSIQVLSRNLEAQTITGDQINYHYVSSGEVLSLLKEQKPYRWITGMYEQHSYTVAEEVTYDKTLLQEQIKSLNCAQEANQVEPENAYVAYQNNQFVIVPETEGSKLDIKQAYQALDAAVEANETVIDFSSTEGAYETATVTQNDADLQAALEACNNYTKASITYTFGDATETIDGNTIKDWLQFDEKGQLIWDDNSFQQHIAEYVATLAAAYDTVGTQRTFYTTSGRVVYVYGANYGWKIDQASEAAQLSAEIQFGTQTTREPVYKQSANSRGTNDLGNTYIEVDLSNQHMYYYQNGSVIFESDFVSGNMSYEDRQTHAGIFTLYYKKSPDVLRGEKKADGTYEYEQDVQYWMPFDGGIGFHDANWRSEFGGDIYLTSGSHGCINLPPENAAVLYNLIDYNVPIVVFY